MANETETSLKELHEQFDDNGYVILHDFFPGNVVTEIIAATKEVTQEHIADLYKTGKIQDRWDTLSWETRLDHVYRQCADDPPTVFRTELHKEGFYSLFCYRRLLDIIEKILGPELRLYPNYSIRPKLPDNEAMLIFWHQDAAYTNEMNPTGSVSNSRMVNVWTPLVPATVENGCMQFVPKTHKLGLVGHTRKNRFYLQIDDEYLQPRLDQAIDIELNPGDVVFFSNLLFHQGLPNRSQTIRWSADWRYQDATQSTLREETGHRVRSRSHLGEVVRNAEHWAELSFT